MSRHGGPEKFGFWKSILVAFAGFLIIICGLAFFERFIWLSILLVIVGAFIILVAAEAGKGRMRGLFTDPHTDVKVKPREGRHKDLPYNPWDAVSGKKDD